MLGSAVDRSSSCHSPVTVLGWCQYTRLPESFAQQDVWSWCLAPVRLTVPSAWTHVPQLRDLCLSYPTALAALVAAHVVDIAVDPLPLLSRLLLLTSPLIRSRCGRCSCRGRCRWSASHCRCSSCYGRRESSLSLAHWECPFAVAFIVYFPCIVYNPCYLPGIPRAGYASLVPGGRTRAWTYPIGHTPGCVCHSPQNTCVPTLRSIYGWPEVFRYASFTPGDRCACLYQESPYFTVVSLNGYICGPEFPSWSPLVLQDHTWS